MKKVEGLKEEIQEKVLNAVDFGKDTGDEEIKELIGNFISEELKCKLLTVQERVVLEKEVFWSLRGWDVLQKALEDDEVTEVMVNGRESIFVEKAGHIQKYGKVFSSEDKLRDLIQRIAAGCNRTVNEAMPILDARLADGDRVNVVLAPVALNGPIVTIRKFPKNPITMEKLIESGSLTKEVSEYLKVLVKAGYNIFVSGGTGSGKTTMLNVLSQFISKDERVITIEDSAELQIQGVENLVKLESRNANMEGCHAITIRDLIRTALRMRPDRIIVGEVRGEEAVDMMQCLNTGHDGSMSTGHANSARDMISRLETMILMGMDIPLDAIRKQIASGLDIIVHLGRLRDKSRRVLEICEVEGYRNGEVKLHTLFEFVEEGEEEDGTVKGHLEVKGDLIHVGKLVAQGTRLPCDSDMDFSKGYS